MTRSVWIKCPSLHTGGDRPSARGGSGKAGLAGSASTEREMATNAGEGRKYLAAKGGQGSARGRIRQDSMLVKWAHL